MAINKKLINFRNKETFTREHADGNILPTSIVFIDDTKEIFTHNTLFSCDSDAVKAWVTEQNYVSLASAGDLWPIKFDEWHNIWNGYIENDYWGHGHAEYCTSFGSNNMFSRSSVNSTAIGDNNVLQGANGCFAAGRLNNMLGYEENINMSNVIIGDSNVIWESKYTLSGGKDCNIQNADSVFAWGRNCETFNSESAFIGGVANKAFSTAETAFGYVNDSGDLPGFYGWDKTNRRKLFTIGNGAFIDDEGNNIQSIDAALEYVVDNHTDRLKSIGAFKETASPDVIGTGTASAQSTKGNLTSGNKGGLVDAGSKVSVKDLDLSTTSLDDVLGNNIVRHNAFEVLQSGDIYVADTFAEGKWYEKPMMHLQEVLPNQLTFSVSAENYMSSMDYLVFYYTLASYAGGEPGYVDVTKIYNERQAYIEDYNKLLESIKRCQDINIKFNLEDGTTLSNTKLNFANMISSEGVTSISYNYTYSVATKSDNHISVNKVNAQLVYYKDNETEKLYSINLDDEDGNPSGINNRTFDL